MAAARASPRISQRAATVVAAGQGLSDEHKQQRAVLAGDGEEVAPTLQIISPAG